MTTPKQQYTAEFKQEAVRLVQSTNKRCVQIARDPGVPAHHVVRWKKQQEVQGAKGRPVFTGRDITGRFEQEDRIKYLERELEIARQERDILKKVVTFWGSISLNGNRISVLGSLQGKCRVLRYFINSVISLVRSGQVQIAGHLFSTPALISRLQK